MIKMYYQILSAVSSGAGVECTYILSSSLQTEKQTRNRHGRKTRVLLQTVKPIILN